jgi:hypothetical protein
VFTDFVIDASLAGALTVSLAVANEEINVILIPVVAVRHFVLTKKGCRLHEEVARFGSLCGFS